MKILTSVLVVSGLCMTALSQNHLVIPAAYATSDANALGSIPGATEQLREQTIIGAAHLTSLVGKQLTAIEFRRNATATTFDAGAANLTIKISSMAAPTYDCSRTFDSNEGTDVVEVWNSTINPSLPVSVVLPNSPPAAGPNVAWTSDNVIRIEFTTPFLYNGGRLCVDITGSAVAGLEAENWIADAYAEDAKGTFQNIGGGCGTYASHTYVDEYSLVVGNRARFMTLGTPFFFGFAVTGQPQSPGLPLSFLGFNPPGNCELMLSTMDVFAPVFLTDILSPTMGYGTWELDIPNNGALQGLGFTTQWFDYATQATTDALSWTIGAAPSLDMATVSGETTSAEGRVVPNIAHVIRFEYE
jgi:hypothetical protein